MPTFDLQNLQSQGWLKRLTLGQKDLLTQSLFLLSDMKAHPRKFYDYSFIVMPAAKAFEGFVKELLFKTGLISERKYKGDRFRVGKALNPELEHIPKLKRIALYDDLGNLFDNKEVPAKLWQTWKECRNRIFHFFPAFKQAITLREAEERLAQVFETIEFASGEYKRWLLGKEKEL